MRIQPGDSVILGQEPSAVGIIERRQGDTLTLRFPDHENRRERASRREVRALAEVIYEARKRGTRYGKALSVTGGSTLADLVETFGYATQRLRSESLERVVRQLQRAGLEVHPESDRWDRDDRFRLVLTSNVLPDPDTLDSSDDTLQTLQILSDELTDPFWPTALGLDPNLELAFLRALTAPDPILCLLHIPDDTNMQGWLQATWEGLISWAFHAAQRFNSFSAGDRLSPRVFIDPPAVLQTYIEASVLHAESPRLQDGPLSLNLISLRKRSDSPVDFQRLRAASPSPVFDFTPEPSVAADGQPSEDVRALVKCLLLTSGSPTEVKQTLSPLKTLLWSKQACMQILAGASSNFGEILASGELAKFKGSSEGSTALALKAHLARWIKRMNKNAALCFEENQVQQVDEWGNVSEMNRIDLLVEGQGRFEVESMAGSGPIEAFYHQKVFARLKRDGAHFWLVVPNEAVLCAGLYLADLAYHLSSGGSVLIPSAGGAYLKLQGRPLSRLEIEVPWDDLRGMSAIGGGETREEEASIRLKGVAGYEEIRERVEELIIWPEKHRRALRRPSRSSGILFFGPPGCGKSRLARAIAGERDQEVRLLSPSDLRGPYIGWGL